MTLVNEPEGEEGGHVEGAGYNSRLDKSKKS
jgi:hypothetical protein